MKGYIDFFHDIFEKECGVPDIYQKITHTESNDVLYEVDNDDKHNLDNLYCLKYVPDYMQLSLKHSSLYRVNSIKGENGFSVNLKNHENIDDYLTSQFKSKPRSAIRKYIKRLESSFNIEYKMYFGEIEDSEYDYLMSVLRDMLNRRFEQRNGVDVFKNRWKALYDLILKLLREKKASLFVVYNNKVPIAITANYHFNDKVFFYWMPSYDIDYSIFRLGHIVIYKELEWCFKNNYSVYDMGRGALDYKRKWCNRFYNFNYQYIYKASSLWALMAFKKEYNKMSIKNNLKKNKTLLSVNKLRMSLKKSNTSKKAETVSGYSITKMDSLETFDTIKTIDFSEDKYIKIRKPINDFIYTNVLHVSEIEVFEVLKNEKFIIKGKSKLQLITLK